MIEKGIKVDVEKGTVDLVDKSGKSARYHRLGSVDGAPVVHAVCEHPNRCTMTPALTEADDFPEDLFVYHASPGPNEQHEQPPAVAAILNWMGVYRYGRDTLSSARGGAEGV